MHVYACFVAEISTSSTWCQPLNNSSVLLQPHSSLRLLNCYLDYFIKHSFICGPLLQRTDFGSSFFKLMTWAMGVINSQNIINMINFQAEMYYIRISTMSTLMSHCQSKYYFGENTVNYTLQCAASPLRTESPAFKRTLQKSLPWFRRTSLSSSVQRTVSIL